MSPQVSSKISTLGKCPITLITFVRFFSSMSTHVDFERARPHEFIIAYITEVWPLS